MPSPRKLEACAEHKLSVADRNKERRKQVQRAQWLRAAILGAIDGLLSVTLLMLGVGAAKENKQSMILSGIAGALAGACSMAVGEFVSVSTQRDIESCSNENGGDVELQISVGAGGSTVVESKPPETDLAIPPPSRTIPCEKLRCDGELSSEKMPAAMTPEQKFAQFFSPARSPMMKVILEDAEKNAVQGAEEEYDKKEKTLPNPYKAAAASALAFLFGSLVPLLSAMFLVKNTIRIAIIVVVTSIALVLFGGIGAHLGGSPVRISAVRVLLGGWLSMAITYGLLKPFDRDDKGNH